MKVKTGFFSHSCSLVFQAAFPAALKLNLRNICSPNTSTNNCFVNILTGFLKPGFFLNLQKSQNLNKATRRPSTRSEPRETIVKLNRTQSHRNPLISHANQIFMTANRRQWRDAKRNTLAPCWGFRAALKWNEHRGSFYSFTVCARWQLRFAKGLTPSGTVGLILGTDSTTSPNDSSKPSKGCEAWTNDPPDGCSKWTIN